jgi:colanic acid/amylovoran biosynthesis glycosyltransferase
MSMLTMVHSNTASIDNGMFKVDRKFHVGMQAYVKGVRVPLITINPETPPGTKIMDLIEVPLEDLPYRVMTVKMDRSWRPLPTETTRMREQIANSKLVYDSGSLGTPKIARALRIPYILVLEYDLATQITVATSQVSSRLRQVVRTLRCAWNHAADEIPNIRGAQSVHCNGYPIYQATRSYNSNRLLYLDSRMSSDMMIPREQLLSRLATRAQRPFRLLYSGRYERLKGADDAVQVAVECLRRGLDIEMHFYGQGSLREEMERIATFAPAAGRIHIHDTVPYPELVAISRSFDLFVCCHIQNDPSCTYLESFGAGLPVVGYANRMWAQLRDASRAGLASPLGHPEKVADDVQRLASDFTELSSMSEKALDFAMEHSYEREFAKRINALNEATR